MGEKRTTDEDADSATVRFYPFILAAISFFTCMDEGGKSCLYLTKFSMRRF